MKRTQKGWARIVMSALLATAVYAALTGLLSLLIVKGSVGEGKSLIGMPIVACAAALIGAVAAGEANGVKLGCAAVFWIAVVCIGLTACGTVDPRKAALLGLPILFGTALTMRRSRGKGRGTKKQRRSRK